MEFGNIENLESGCNAADRALKATMEEKDHLENKIRNKKEQLFKKTKELFELREKEASLLGEISGALAAGKNWQAALNKKDQDIQR